MMNSRTHRRRASDLNGGRTGDDAPSIFEVLLNTFTDGLARSAMLRLKRGLQGTVRWTLLRLILGGIGAGLATGGLLLLLGAGVLGLVAAQWPLWLACLTTAGVTLLLALVAMRGILWPKDVEDED